MTTRRKFLQALGLAPIAAAVGTAAAATVPGPATTFLAGMNFNRSAPTALGGELIKYPPRLYPGSVQNFALATVSEAQLGTSNATYMTPERVRQSIAALDDPGKA